MDEDIGLQRFILGNGYRDDNGIFKYKKSFAPNGVYDFYIGKKVFDKKKYEKLVEIRIKEKGFNQDTSFFPVYRA